MAIHVTFDKAQEQFNELFNLASQNHETVIIHRRKEEPVTLIAVSELEGMKETIYLLRSPANAKRLFAALKRAEQQR